MEACNKNTNFTFCWGKNDYEFSLPRNQGENF